MYISSALRAGLAFMTLHFPDEVETNRLTIEAADPKSGTAEFKATAIRIDKLHADVPLMDLHLMTERSRPTRNVVRSTRCWDPRSRPTTGWFAAVTRPRATGPLLLPALHALHAAEGWISEGGLNYICERLTVPPAEAYGVATFYAMFSVQPPADDRRARLRRPRLPDPGREGAPHRARVAGRRRRLDLARPSPCLGMCEQAPAILAQRARAARTWRSAGRPWRPSGRSSAPDSTGHLCGGRHRAAGVGPATFARASGCSRRVGEVDPSSIDAYRAAGRLRGAAARDRTRARGDDREITDAKLLGRGGAAFPTGVKWKAVAEQSVRPHFVICNADESEPGTFKDRLVMELDPFAVRRGAHDRRLRHGRGTGLPLRPR